MRPHSTPQCTRSAHAVATFTRLKSGSWRVQVRRKGKYVNDTFLRRKDAEEWALEIERRIDRGEPPLAASSRELRRFGDLVRLHRDDLQEVGKRIGRSKSASLAFLEERLGRLALQELDRDRLIQFGKERAVEGAGPVTLSMDLVPLHSDYDSLVLGSRPEAGSG